MREFNGGVLSCCAPEEDGINTERNLIGQSAEAKKKFSASMQDSSHAAQRRVIGGIQNHGIICFPGKEDKKWAHYGQKLPEDETFGFRGAPFYSLGAQAKQENIVNASARQFVSFVGYRHPTLLTSFRE